MNLALSTNPIRGAARRTWGRARVINRTLTTLRPAGDPLVAAKRANAPFRLAIIGAGPSGFYAAYRVQSKLPTAKIDMYEALPVPFGLVRFGVAPDHPEVKFCINKFDEVARHPNFTFIGNTPIGSDAGRLPFPALLPHYDAILLSYGASEDKKLGIEGEDKLSGIHSARAFVGWYNGLPEHRDLNPDLASGDGKAVIIGQGNVALDVARILLTDVDELRKTDITEYALEALSRSKIKEVEVVGRRGPLQVAFTIKEVRELMRLAAVGFKPIDPTLISRPLEDLPRPQKRLLETVITGSKQYPDLKNWGLSFFSSPRKFLSSSAAPSKLSHIRFENTEPDPDSINERVRGTGVTKDVYASLAFRSIGYRSQPLQGMVEAGVPFDRRRGIISNSLGRVVKPAPGGGEMQVPGLYTTGWVRRGPTGVIASTMIDAFDAGDNIVNDWRTGVEFLGKNRKNKAGWDAVKVQHQKRGIKAVHWNDWDKIDEAEKQRGQKVGKEREKFGTVDEMLAVLP
ncbi:NADPH-adrenodoxin reductase [Orbilia brochopaga]|uniref:NADPH:adrenodoxin oxidoreductase, mitochondrial n=1 Tax=Orbilia brochopaga TaxID=3140254 RepID=A0AAV9UWQ6_9PEZI